VVQVRSREDRDERGAIAVVVALFALGMFVLAALVLDLGIARDTRRQSQNAADAAALAAVNALYPVSARCNDGNPTPATGCRLDAATAAKEYAESNFGVSTAEWASCKTDFPAGYAPVTGFPTCISIDAIGQHVRVLLPARRVDTPLGVLAGISHVDIASSARAAIKPASAADCSLCVIGEGEHSVKNLAITATTGDIQINGTSTLANKGGYTASAGTVKLEQSGLPSKGTVSTPNLLGQAPLPDPFENLPAPAYSTSPFTVTSGDTSHTNLCNGPGVYVDPSFTGCTTIPPGLYVIASGTVNFNGITAPANTFYFTCATTQKIGKNTQYTPRPCNANSGAGESGANYDLTGNGATTLVAPTIANKVGDAVPGMLLWSDKYDNTQVKLTGTTGLQLTGTVYMKSGQLYVGGTADALGIKAQFILGDLAGNGDATFKLAPDDAYEAKVLGGRPSLDQ
jgi:hypothetical protein